MKIQRLLVSDFGKFHQEEFTFSSGLNIATGENESGKTTLRRFIRSMFYGLERERGIRARKDDYTRYKPWEHGYYQGIMEFEAEGEQYRLYRNFLTTEKEVRLTNLDTGKEFTDVAENLQQLGLVSEAVYTNTFWVGNACVTEELLARELKEYLANLAYTGGAGLNLQKSLAWLNGKKKDLARQLPEQEIQRCLEMELKQEALQKQAAGQRQILAGYLQRQKELEEAVKAKRGQMEEVLEIRNRLEQEMQIKFRGERILLFGCMTAILIFCLAVLAPAWQWKAVGGVLGSIVAGAGCLFGISRIKRGKQAGQEKEQLDGNMTALAEQQQGCYDELTRLLPEMEQEKLRLEQTEEALQQCELAGQRYEELAKRYKRLTKEIEAVKLASETLVTLSGELYEEFGAKFAKALSAYAREFTDRHYENLVADEELNLRAVTKERMLELTEVSFGTAEQFYLALRFAAADVFDPEKKNPVILDDSFAAFDEQRLESAILALARLGRQVIVFSSTGREEAAAKRMGITYEAIF